MDVCVGYRINSAYIDKLYELSASIIAASADRGVALRQFIDAINNDIDYLGLANTATIDDLTLVENDNGQEYVYDSEELENTYTLTVYRPEAGRYNTIV